MKKHTKILLIFITLIVAAPTNCALRGTKLIGCHSFGIYNDPVIDKIFSSILDHPTTVYRNPHMGPFSPNMRYPKVITGTLDEKNKRLILHIPSRSYIILDRLLTLTAGHDQNEQRFIEDLFLLARRKQFQITALQLNLDFDFYTREEVEKYEQNTDIQLIKNANEKDPQAGELLKNELVGIYKEYHQHGYFSTTYQTRIAAIEFTIKKSNDKNLPN